ncbi:MAG TPA: ABC transporter substrate-binding protein [Chloroflexota bacterium]|nr:ABC transporter substrate-binding protein [Chloroflexota bacterium]
MNHLKLHVLVLTLLLAACGSMAAPASSPAGSPPPGSKPAAGSASAAAKALSIKVGYASLTGNSAPIYIAHDAGFFAKNGLNADSSLISGSPKTIQALVAGDIDFAIVGSSATVQANLGGADLSMIATAAPGLAFRIYAKPPLEKIADLKGKRIAESIIGSDPDFALRLALPRYNLAYSDVQIVQLPDGGDPARLTAIQAGTADAAILTGGNFARAEKDFKLKLILDIGKEDITYEQATVAVNRKYTASHPEETTRFLRAFSESVHYFQANRDQTLAILKKYMKVDDPEVLAETWDYSNILKVKGLPFVSEPGVQSMLDLVVTANPAAKGHKAAEYIDSSFLTKLEAEGFKG